MPPLTRRLISSLSTTTTSDKTPKMPPMSFIGTVTKVGYMHKTATVTVSRWVVHPKTRKVSTLHWSFRTSGVLAHIHLEARTEQKILDPRRIQRYAPHLCIFKGLATIAPPCLALRIHDTVLIRNFPPIPARKRFTLEKILKSPETELDEIHARMAEAAKQIHVDGADAESPQTALS